VSDLGMMLAWVAVQVTIVGVPCVAAHALASRRGPSSGAWVAAVSLGLVVLLNVWGLLAMTGRESVSAAGPASMRPPTTAVASASGAPEGGSTQAMGRDRPRLEVGLAALRLAWSRFGRGAAVPAEKCRPWGRFLTVVTLAGTGFCVLRFMTGLWAIRTFRRRGRAVEDPGMIRLLVELRRAMGSSQQVELLETADLSTPATAGWMRPVLFLPDDWRTWDDSERRAVFAHELAHITRGDYAVGLLTRLAVAMNYYHPLVRWVAGQLQVQQEQAADVLGAQFAGGCSSYLVALSRLALKQDTRLPSWPARAFLPGPGALIRRITMLRDQDGSMASDRPLTATWRVLTLCSLLGATFAVATFRGPVRAADDAPVANAPANPRATETRIEPPYAQLIAQTLPPYPLPADITRSFGEIAAQSDVLIFGEMHGTQEVPAVAASLLTPLTNLGYSMLALEIPSDQQATLTAWATGKTDAVPGFFAKPNGDGRGNIQLLTLIRTALSPPFRWRLICFDETEADEQRHFEELMRQSKKGSRDESRSKSQPALTDADEIALSLQCDALMASTESQESNVRPSPTRVYSLA
jgi:beta-lactamase regulating signal transducer with metallopeptidase domain